MTMFVNTFDKRITKDIQSLPTWVAPIMRIATFIGLPIFTTSTGAMLAIAGLLMQNQGLLQTGIIVMIVIGVGTVFKLLLRRNRPLTDYVLNMRFSTYSLPSGHAVGSLVAYGALGYVYAAGLPNFLGALVSVVAICIAITIGVSRIYLGAHYPTDVVAGWLLGGAGLLIIILIVEPIV